MVFNGLYHKSALTFICKVPPKQLHISIGKNKQPIVADNDCVGTQFHGRTRYVICFLYPYYLTPLTMPVLAKAIVLVDSAVIIETEG